MVGIQQESGLVALAIAGFDPSSGAGITADLAVFAMHGVFGTSAITSLTVQSTVGVRHSEAVSPDLLAETLACLHEDLPPNGIKIGMLGGAPQVRTVVDYLRPLRGQREKPVVVLDPVIRSSSGAALLDKEGTAMLESELLPLVDVVTPNAEELSVLTGMPCTDPEERVMAGRRLMSAHPELTVLVTGGDDSEPDDLLMRQELVTALHGRRVDTSSTHGTGCAFSSALLCRLLHGEELLTAATGAKLYVASALKNAVSRGRGRGPMNLLWPVSRQEED